jgi:hypothetical protein
MKKINVFALAVVGASIVTGRGMAIYIRPAVECSQKEKAGVVVQLNTNASAELALPGEKYPPYWTFNASVQQRLDDGNWISVSTRFETKECTVTDNVPVNSAAVSCKRLRPGQDPISLDFVPGKGVTYSNIGAGEGDREVSGSMGPSYCEVPKYFLDPLVGQSFYIEGKDLLKGWDRPYYGEMYGFGASYDGMVGTVDRTWFEGATPKGSPDLYMIYVDSDHDTFALGKDIIRWKKYNK